MGMADIVDSLLNDGITHWQVGPHKCSMDSIFAGREGSTKCFLKMHLCICKCHYKNVILLLFFEICSKMNYRKLDDETELLLDSGETGAISILADTPPYSDSPPPYQTQDLTSPLSWNQTPMTLTWEGITVSAPPEKPSCLPWKKKNVPSEPRKLLDNGMYPGSF